MVLGGWEGEVHCALATCLSRWDSCNRCPAQTPAPEQWLCVQLPAFAFLCFSFSWCWSSLGCLCDRSSTEPVILGSVFHGLPFLHWGLAPGAQSGSCFDDVPFPGCLPLLILLPHLALESLSHGWLLRDPKLRQPTTNRPRYSSRSVFLRDYGGKYQKGNSPMRSYLQGTKLEEGREADAFK